MSIGEFSNTIWRHKIRSLPQFEPVNQSINQYVIITRIGKNSDRSKTFIPITRYLKSFSSDAQR